MNLTDTLASYVRTGVPIIVGSLIAIFVKRFPGVGDWLDQGEVSAWLTPLTIAVYYAAVRSAEKRWPNIGWLLGLAKQPGYADAPAPPAQPAPEG